MGNLVTGLLGALILGSLGSWFFLWVAKREGESWPGYPLIVSLALKLLIVFVISPIYYDHYAMNDSNAYDKLGMQFAAHLRQGQWVPLHTYFNQSIYSYLTGVVYALFGPSRYLMEVINALVSTLGLYFFYKGFKLVLVPHHLKLLTLFICLWPSLLLWNSLHLRDPWLFLSIGLFTYGSALGMGATWLRSLILLGISLVGMLLFRSYVAAVAFAAAMPLIVLFKPFLTGRRASLARWGGMVLFIVLGMLVFVASARLATGSQTLSYEVFEQFYNLLATGGSALPPIHFSSWWDLLAYLPQGILTILFRPFPWEAYNLPGLLASVENALLFVLLVLSLPQWPQLLRREARALWPAWAFLMLLVVVLAPFEGNLATIFRQKAQLMPFLLALGTLSLESLWRGLTPRWRETA
jgi:hypothetical protein